MGGLQYDLTSNHYSIVEAEYARLIHIPLPFDTLPYCSTWSDLTLLYEERKKGHVAGWRPWGHLPPSAALTALGSRACVRRGGVLQY